jgi:hypothetical protein
MDSAKINDWMQVLGIFAVVASLVFVGLQMKQSHEIALAVQYHERTVLAVDYVLAQHEHGNFGTWATWCGQEFSQDTPERAGHDCINAHAALQIHDNHYFQYQSGFLDEESWRARRKSLKSVLAFPIFREALKSPLPLRSSFVALCNDLIAEIDGEAVE